MAALQHLSSSITAPLPSQLRSRFRFRCRLVPSASAGQTDNTITRRQLIGGIQAATAAISLYPLGRKVLAAEDPLSEWERVFLPIDPGVVLLDIAFVPDDPSHGWFLHCLYYLAYILDFIAAHLLKIVELSNRWKSC